MLNFFCNFCNEEQIQEIDNINILYYLQDYIDKYNQENNNIIYQMNEINNELLKKFKKKNRKVSFYTIVKVILIPNRHEEKYHYFMNDLQNLKNKKY